MSHTRVNPSTVPDNTPNTSDPKNSNQSVNQMLSSSQQQTPFLPALASHGETDEKENSDNFYPLFSLGNNNFVEVIEKGYTFVDKTMYIRNIIDDANKQPGSIKFFLRYRRCGKTLFLNTLKAYFAHSKPKKEHLFYNLDVWKKKDGGSYKKRKGEFTVIFISFKHIDEDTFKNALEAINCMLSTLYQTHDNFLSNIDLPKSEKKYIKKMRSGENISAEDRKKAIPFLLEKFAESKEESIVLIDEYDTPINAGCRHNYYKSILDAMKDVLYPLLSADPKDRKFYFLAVTGVLNYLSDLVPVDKINNTSIYDENSKEYSACFGFTKDEVNNIFLNHFGQPAPPEIDKWYGGYMIGDTYIYNPWSIINFVIENWKNRKEKKDYKYVRYWAGITFSEKTEQILKQVINSKEREYFKDFIQRLLNNHLVIKDKVLVNPVANKHTDSTLKTVLSNQINWTGEFFSYLISSGFLTLYYPHASSRIACRIPNLEVYHFYSELYKKIQNVNENDLPSEEKLNNIFTPNPEEKVSDQKAFSHNPLSSEFFTQLKEILKTIKISNDIDHVEKLFLLLTENLKSLDAEFLDILKYQFITCKTFKSDIDVLYFTYILLCFADYDIIGNDYEVIKKPNAKPERRLSDYKNRCINLNNAIIDLVKDFLPAKTQANLEAISHINNKMIADNNRQNYAIALIKDVGEVIRLRESIHQAIKEAFNNKLDSLLEAIDTLLNNEFSSKESSLSIHSLFKTVAMNVPDSPAYFKNCVIS